MFIDFLTCIFAQLHDALDAHRCYLLCYLCYLAPHRSCWVHTLSFSELLGRPVGAANGESRGGSGAVPM
eukprot:s475_g28.t1